MKRLFCLFLVSLTLMLCACGGAPAQSDTPDTPITPPVSETPPAPAEPAPSVPETPAQPETPTVPETPPAPAEPAEPVPVGPTNPLTGLPTEESLVNRKPVAIMLNNIKVAQPQQGNSQADIIYEVLAEGGITRMLGIYHDISQLGMVGSVRSARLYYLELALGHDAVFVHAGGSPEFYEKAKAWKLNTVDGVNGFYSSASTGLFWRDKNRVPGQNYAYEHSLVTSGSKLTSVLTKQGELKDHASGYSTGLLFTANGTPAGGNSAQTVVVPFSSGKVTAFLYDAAAGTYKVEQHSDIYTDGNDGTPVTVTNVVALQTECKVVDDEGRLNIDLSSGKGWFACGGKYIPITWEKGNRNEPLKFFTEDGKPLNLGQGKSYICIIPESRQIATK